MLAKTRVTPISGISIPRSEANGLLYAYKLVHVALRALRVKPSAVHFLIDSSCLMAAIQSTRGKLSPYLANRKAQVEEYVQEWTELYPSTEVFLPRHIPGHRNIADLATRGLAAPSDVDLGSQWQCGSPILSLPVNCWPITKEKFENIPEEELLPKYRTNAMKVTALPPIFLKLRSIFGYFSSYERCIGTLARLLRVSREAAVIPGGLDKVQDEQKIKESLAKDVSVDDIVRAERIAFLLFQSDVDDLLQNPTSFKQKVTNKRKFHPDF